MSAGNGTDQWNPLGCYVNWCMLFLQIAFFRIGEFLIWRVIHSVCQKRVPIFIFLLLSTNPMKQQTKCVSGIVINLRGMFNKKTSCFDRCQSSAVIVKLNVWITKTWTAADLQEALLAKFPMFCFIFTSLVCSYCVHLLYHLLSFVTLWSTFFFPGRDWLLSFHYYWFISL